ncbi:hypothetical protein B4U80_10883 [Leptotrombidium deliense]|uniref:CUB domain-containing protein n=1 Tax=Leptotrombidium deliense TaxID=299467 RepID=A0A443S3K9_9ACAR|nr:hypothetical protein B4U80_10883 [Leptotrombidium deliense]
MHSTKLLLFAAFLEIICGTGAILQFSNSTDNFNSDRGRRLSFLRPSIFNVVRFSNDECYDGGNQSGTCYTPIECKTFGGSGTAMCANGYGTCCISSLFSKSCHNTTSQKVVYFKNPSYPASDNQQNYCDLSIDVKDADICQLRLDFLDFQLDPPTKGRCLGDRLSVTASKLATNSIPTLCGLNRHSHIYVSVPQDANSKAGRSASILFVTNNNGAYRWHLRITQIECTKMSDLNRVQKSFFGFIPEAALKVSLPAPQGCLQYYSTASGVIESFNFGHYLANMDYAICIERLPDTCKVVFSSSIADWAIDKNDAYKDTAGVGDIQCSNDYLLIPGGSRDGEGPTFDRFCGGKLSYSKSSQEPAPVVSKANGPIVLRFHTDNQLLTQNNLGFRVQFTQETTNCQSVSSNIVSNSLSVASLSAPVLSGYTNFQNTNENLVLRSNTKYLRLK